jgi:hypothetical protein
MKKFDYKERNLISGIHLLGPILIFVGLFALVSPVFLKSESSMEKIIGVGVGAIIIGFGIISSYSGTQIDFSEKKVMEYFSLGGFRMGKWTTLPDILKVKVISNSYIKTNTPNGVSPTFSGKVTDFKTLLYSEASKPVFSFFYSNKATAVKDAKIIASNLNAKLVLNIHGSE